jgi:hypothetical protein
MSILLRIELAALMHDLVVQILVSLRVVLTVWFVIFALPWFWFLAKRMLKKTTVPNKAIVTNVTTIKYTYELENIPLLKIILLVK